MDSPHFSSSPPHPENAPRRGRWSFWIVGGIFSLLLTSGLVWSAWHLLTPHQGYAEPEVFVLIPRGSSLGSISQVLEDQGVIRSAFFFKAYLRLTRGSPSLKAGEYRFDRPLTISDVAEKLLRGDIYYHRVTIPEGLVLERIAEILEAAGFGGVERYQQIMKDPTLISELDAGAEDLEGYLYPDTYFLTRDMDEDAVVRRMVGRFREIWTPEKARRAKELEMSVREIVTLSSLIEKETAMEDERPLISAVFHNRLKLNMKLDCDPTVIYAVSQVKEYDGIIHRSDLALDSPYNTYLYPGLPPGPIANPGEKSIQAALYPAEQDYLFFVSRNDGSHIFSSTYGEHRQAVNRYQR